MKKELSLCIVVFTAVEALVVVIAIVFNQLFLEMGSCMMVEQCLITQEVTKAHMASELSDRINRFLSLGFFSLD